MLYAVLTIIVVLGLLFWNYGRFASNVVRWCKPLKITGKKVKRPEMSFSESLVCYIPWYQVLLVRRALFGSFGWTLPVGAISAFLVIVRLINAFLLPINAYVMLVTTFMMWLGLLLYFLLYGIVTFQVARMYEFSMLLAVLCFVLPQLFCMFMSDAIAGKMRDMHKEERFSEHGGDTVVKSKHR